MALQHQLAKHLRDVHFGGNWTCSNLKDSLQGLTWQQANQSIDGLNSIAALVFHMNYFVVVAKGVLRGEGLNAHDKYSFDLPLIEHAEAWESLCRKTFNDAEELAQLIENMPEALLWEDFTDKKYGNYLRNVLGIIEHCHYHLGQVVLARKLLSGTIASPQG